MVTLKSRAVFETILKRFYYDSMMSEKDHFTLRRRVAIEGDYFIMRLLPIFFEAVLNGIETGTFTPPIGFKNYRCGGKRTNLTCLFKEKLSLLFETSGALIPPTDGNSLAQASALMDMRQVCLAFNKIKSEFSDEQKKKSEEQFRRVDSEVKVDFCNLSIRELTIFDYARDYLDEIFKDFDCKDIKPGHGSGVTSNSLSHAERRMSDNLCFYGELHERYPYYTWFFCNTRALASSVDKYWSAKKRGTSIKPYSRLALVPKDSRGPRVICIEPPEFMWLQQGLMKKLYNHLETNKITRGQINFTDQSINRRLACESSLTRDLCTMDMKDASDMVSAQLVRQLFPKHIASYLMALRTGRALLPTIGMTAFLKKYASMGNALTFPVEALVFWSLIKATMKYEGKFGKAYVYGDDLIFRSDLRDSVTKTLEGFGLKVNHSKTFSRGFFRESCGGDYYYGVDITPIRIRTLGRDASDLLSMRTADQFFNKGLWNTTGFIDQLAEEIASSHRVRLGFTSPSYDETLSRLQCFTKSEALYAYAPSHNHGYNHKLQYLTVRLPAIKARASVLRIDEDDAYFVKITERFKGCQDTVPESFEHSSETPKNCIYMVRKPI